ncbi:DUF938 domain-containing protein [Psychrobacter aestuarii]|uniref:Class I SAM-dependent methyltransferase n=1 Tax=Psychrobacter aestuarii TaxID=556327 RepID=A0ABP3FSN6_9GAMM|nr:DUF938 domain-containing protein [Psychrobacter aestuarii]
MSDMPNAARGNTDVSMLAALPFSQACENNREPILSVLRELLTDSKRVLEIGSGTGQHSVYFAPRLPHVSWQTSDVPANHAAIHAWQQQYPADNVQPPLVLDLTSLDDIRAVTARPYDAVFTANTLHIVSWDLVLRLLGVAASVLPADGLLIVYGPFNEHGDYTSAGNRQFDAALQARGMGSAIRDIETVTVAAGQMQLSLIDRYAMPANNQLLVFQKQPDTL